jgi:hypothetical protein
MWASASTHRRSWCTARYAVCAHVIPLLYASACMGHLASNVVRMQVSGAGHQLQPTTWLLPVVLDVYTKNPACSSMVHYIQGFFTPPALCCVVQVP